MCVYSIDMIEDVFETSTFKGYSNDIPTPRPGTVNTAPLCVTHRRTKLHLPWVGSTRAAILLCSDGLPFSRFHLQCFFPPLNWKKNAVGTSPISGHILDREQHCFRKASACCHVFYTVHPLLRPQLTVLGKYLLDSIQFLDAVCVPEPTGFFIL